MTSDLYYTQLCEIDNYKINDKRDEPFLKKPPEINPTKSNSIAFYSVISKKENSSSWISTLTIIESDTEKTESKEYDSFYKILMEPKSKLQDTLITLISKKQGSSDEDAFNFGDMHNSFPIQEFPSMETTKSEISTEFLAGDWSGEGNIDKIIILRGGRGFVTFSNGATMSVEIKAKKSSDKTYITITEKGRPNASYFQELNRQIALRAAVNASPISWEFILTDNNTLTGLKNTLVELNGEAVSGQIETTWLRKS